MPPKSAGIPPSESGPLTFPRVLLRQPPSQVDLAYDSVTALVEQLEGRAATIAGRIGLPYSADLNQVMDPAGGATREPAGALMLLAILAHVVDEVSLEKRAGRWGLYFTRKQPIRGAAGISPTVPLRDAPIEVRMKFLETSEQFFRGYFAKVKQTLKEPAQALEMGTKTLDLLNDIREE